MTPSERKIASIRKISSIRKEIGKDVKKGMSLIDAREKANLKYGKSWRKRGLTKNPNSQWTDEELKPFIK
ncbi:MAG: hypothetical protein ACK5KP_11135 [Paludibacteraceae bacterium]